MLLAHGRFDPASNPVHALCVQRRAGIFGGLCRCRRGAGGKDLALADAEEGEGKHPSHFQNAGQRPLPLRHLVVEPPERAGGAPDPGGRQDQQDRAHPVQRLVLDIGEQVPQAAHVREKAPEGEHQRGQRDYQEEDAQNGRDRRCKRCWHVGAC